MIQIDVSCEGTITLPYKTLTEQLIISMATKICEYLQLNTIIIAIILTDDCFIHEINLQYRNKDRATDVISFAYRENPFPVDMQVEHLGDIFLSLETALVQAEEYGVTFHEEVARLLIHAILHLVGYDHEHSREEEIVMQAKEDELMQLFVNN
jgi:rRNA maturation RNase YbeY